MPQNQTPNHVDEVGVKEAAARLGICKMAVLKAIHEGRLAARWQEKPAVTGASWKIGRPASGGMWLIPLSAVASYSPATQQEKGRRSAATRARLAAENRGADPDARA